MKAVVIPIVLLAALGAARASGAASSGDPGPGRYRNPVLHADFSDPDAVRAGDDFYLTASSFQVVPGLPILHSRDLVTWTIVGHAVERLPSPDFDRAQHGNGLWAPSLRHHGGWFWIYVGDPDRGIFMTRARDPRGPWEPLTLVQEAKGWIDPCPLWDDDGSLYLVHAWARSRAGVNGLLTIRRLSPDGRRVVGEGRTVYEGRDRHPTIEGPKIHKRNGWYYIFAPAGGVRTGWQVVLRSRTVFGPYEERVVMDQGATQVNGPHQGAWVTTTAGEDWFLHFQDRGPYGRVVHLQPMAWSNEWPVIGEDADHDGKGEPVTSWPKPRVTAASGPAPALQTSDAFEGGRLGPQWQWHGQPRPQWASLRARDGHLRLAAVPRRPAGATLWEATHLLLQKLPAEAFTATARLDPGGLREGGRAGLVVMGADYSALVVERTASGLRLQRRTARGADEGAPEIQAGEVPLGGGPLALRVEVSPGAVCRFRFSRDGRTFEPLGEAFLAQPGRWIGAKVGLFADAVAEAGGHADFDAFTVDPSGTAREGVTVAGDGTGDFRTVQAALDAVPRHNTWTRTIVIRPGTYREKVHLTSGHVALVGEDRDRTRLEFAVLREEWRASHPDDWGAAVVNIGPGVTDVVLANLTVLNDYGRRHGGDDRHQFAIRSMGDSTRIALLHVSAIADGGDTVSLWNDTTGLTYYADGYFEGHVDFLCPRGWAYVTNSRFYGHNTSASVWHDGSKDRGQKLVIRRSRFDGVPGFALGRHHRDAQFYLLDVTFSPRMADRPIHAARAPDALRWGTRAYYANVRREGGDFAWSADNLRSAEGAPRDEDVTAAWTFGGRWRPETLPSVLPFAATPGPEDGWRWTAPSGVRLRWTPGRDARAHRVHFGLSDPPPLRVEQPQAHHETGPLVPGATYYWRVDTVTADGVVPGATWSFRADPRAVRVVLAGDSTVTERSGWGTGFKARLEDGAAVINLARGGRSSKSYRDEGHWDAVLRARPTHLLLQFGHNDQPGKGLDRETDLPTFRANLARYVDEARAAGAVPVIVTSLTRRRFTRDGRIDSDLLPQVEAARAVAAEKGAPLVELHDKGIALLERLGPDRARALGPVRTDGTLDNTHLNEEGSALIGALVAEETARVVPALAAHLRAAPAAQVSTDATTRDRTPARWSVRMADSEMRRTPDPMMLDATTRPRWEYTPGLILKAILDVWRVTGDERYWSYAKAYYDGMIDETGAIGGGYRLDEYNIDRINPGKPLFLLYEKTKDERYRRALETLRRQMREHPRTSEGGFWHKKRYPHQMWLDGLYMGAPFLAQYARTFGEPALLDDVVRQFVLMEAHARDEKTGLLYHGWDERREQKWADAKTGRSPAFWGRAIGWYAMGLVETLDFIPEDHPGRRTLVAILGRLAEAVTRVQDPGTGLWYQVIDQGPRDGNYLEASVSTMLSFSLLKAARLGYIDERYGEAGRRAYQGILKQLVEVDKDGLVHLHRVCQVAGLGGDPNHEGRYRSGTFDYYVTEKVRSNDPKGVGPFIFASLEMERGQFK